MRIAKLRSSVDAFLKIGGAVAKVDHLTLMEINTVRPFLPHALDQLFRLRQVRHKFLMNKDRSDFEKTCLDYFVFRRGISITIRPSKFEKYVS